MLAKPPASGMAVTGYPAWRLHLIHIGFVSTNDFHQDQGIRAWPSGRTMLVRTEVSLKFYTKQGNWDLVGNNIPVFFIQDAIKFPDLIHAVKEESDRGFPQAASAHDNFWDFISLSPETLHMIMCVYSDRAIPRSFRFMEGFGIHTFRLISAEGKSTFVKFQWKPKQGLQSVVWNEAVKINGADPDFTAAIFGRQSRLVTFPSGNSVSSSLMRLSPRNLSSTYGQRIEMELVDDPSIVRRPNTSSAFAVAAPTAVLSKMHQTAADRVAWVNFFARAPRFSSEYAE
jgi:Catalase